ncbi:unnamed protein product, partial [Iphiclides podalirius]
MDRLRDNAPYPVELEPLTAATVAEPACSDVSSIKKCDLWSALRTCFILRVVYVTGEWRAFGSETRQRPAT